MQGEKPKYFGYVARRNGDNMQKKNNFLQESVQEEDNPHDGRPVPRLGSGR